MSDEHTRIVLRSQTHFLATDAIDSVLEVLRGADPEEWLSFRTVTGQTALPAETLWVQAKDIHYIQSMSEENWVLQQQWDTKRFADSVAESPSIAESQAKLAEVMAKMFGEEGEEDA